MTNGSEKTREYPEVEEFWQEIESLKKRLSPDSIAKAIDRSWLSVSNLRGFLAILSMILTIFTATAAVFGVMGISNILSIRDEVLRVQGLRKQVESDANAVAIAANSVEAEIQTVKTDTLKATRELIGETQSKVDDLEKQFRTMGRVFNKVALAPHGELNLRERQLLVLLAKETDPDNYAFNLNSAWVSYELGRYDEAIMLCDKVIASSDSPSAIVNSARQLKEKAAGAAPRELQEIKGGPSVGPYKLISLHYNTVQTLINKGYLTGEEGYAIFDKAKNPE